MLNNRQRLFAGFVSGVAVSAVLIASFSWQVLAAGFSARDKPGAFESLLAGFALRHAVPRAYRALKNPYPASTAALAEGREHFADHCATCHANNGDGHTMYGDGLNPAPPDLRLPATQSKTDGQLYAIIQNGIRMTGMPAFGVPGTHDQSTWNLVAFIRHLPSLTPAEQLEMQNANPISPSELEERQREDDFLNGTTSPSKGPSQ